MRRFFTAAVSAAIIATATTEVNAQFVSGIEPYTRYIAVPPQYYRLPFVTRIPGLVVNAFYGNNRTSFDSLNNLLGVIGYVTGNPQFFIPTFSFSNCNANNMFTSPTGC
jgi:hypothetical protein